MGEYISKPTSEMIAEGVAVFDALVGSYATYGLVEQVYIAMRALENRDTLSRDCQGTASGEVEKEDAA